MAVAKKLRPATFKHIEAELYAFHETKKELETLKLDMILESGKRDVNSNIRSNIPGDKTARAVEKIRLHREILHMEHIVASIEKVYNAMPKEKKKLIELKYWTKPQTLTWEGIARKLHVSRRAAIYWRNEIVYAIAELLGWK